MVEQEKRTPKGKRKASPLDKGASKKKKAIKGAPRGHPRQYAQKGRVFDPSRGIFSTPKENTPKPTVQFATQGSNQDWNIDLTTKEMAKTVTVGTSKYQTRQRTKPARAAEAPTKAQSLKEVEDAKTITKLRTLVCNSEHMWSS